VCHSICLLYTTCFGLYWPSADFKIAWKSAALLYLLFPCFLFFVQSIVLDVYYVFSVIFWCRLCCVHEFVPPTRSTDRKQWCLCWPCLYNRNESTCSFDGDVNINCLCVISGFVGCCNIKFY
jgi:hypothetical protein